MQDIRQTPAWNQYLSFSGWNCTALNGINVFARKLPLTPFSVVKIQRFSKPLDPSALKEFQSRNNSFYTILEPQAVEVDLPPLFRLSHSPYLPTKTIILDLAKSEEQLWADLSTNAQRILSRPSNVNIEETDLSQFYSLWHESAKTWILPEADIKYLLSAFGPSARLLVSRSGNMIHSGLILLFSSDTANYYQTWTSNAGRSSCAHYHLVWHSILLAKKLGMKYYDFEGIYDSRFPKKSWFGFSQFKHKFGGKVVEFPGAFTRWWQ